MKSKSKEELKAIWKCNDKIAAVSYTHLSNVEDDELKDMRIVQEMYARGFEFVPIDIYKAKMCIRDSFKKGETEYSLKLLPFGGACIMLGEDFLEADDDEQEDATEGNNTGKSEMCIRDRFREPCTVCTGISRRRYRTGWSC